MDIEKEIQMELEMAAIAPIRPAHQDRPSSPSPTPSPESLRKRQRDRLSPRGRFTKSGPVATAAREVEGSRPLMNGITLWPAPRSKTVSSRSPNQTRKKQLQNGLRKENSVDRRARRDLEDAKLQDLSITPDGGSAGREGRQFTVAKVGNNGRIYLRPTIRPANQRYPQPSFVFPITPPSTAGLDALLPAHDEDENQRSSVFTPTRSPSALAARARDQYSPSIQSGPQPQTPRQKRAMSYSTIDENNVVRDSDEGAFKVVIERPGTVAKPTEPAFVGIPTLEVPIPSYRLGTPRFSARGTAMLRSSGYTATDDMRSSTLSYRESPHRDIGLRRSGLLSRRHSDASRQPNLSRMVSSASDPFDLSIPSAGVARHRGQIVPEMFDSLTFKPACDHPSVVRYSSGGGIRAATPARIVAEITSPTFVDYDLLSDFFLSFRSFLATSDLLHMLVARLKWTLTRDDQIGTVVRVRTFVAIRHWILNYFLDDYVVDYELRTSFCDLLNNFGSGISPDPDRAKAPLKILGELKKCWRRVCALYWDGPEFDTELSSDVPISPGGIAGSRDPRLDPSFWENHPDPPPQIEESIINPEFIGEHERSSEEGNFLGDVSRAGQLSNAGHLQPSQKNRHERPHPDPPLSPTSMTSEDFVSCSFPPRGRAIGTAYPLGAHPVPASSIHYNPPPVALTPKALTGKRVRPTHTHKRSGSFSDSFRDRRTLEQPVPRALYQTAELFLSLPCSGSLVRGNLFPPGQAYVDAIAPCTPAGSSQTGALFSSVLGTQKGPAAMSGPGMKKLLGSVRRALSTRGGGPQNSNASPTQGSFPHIPPLGIRGATINRLPGTAIVPQAPPRNIGVKDPMRIDLLGAEIAEDFKKAVEEEAEAEAAYRGMGEAGLDHADQSPIDNQYSPKTLDIALEPPKLEDRAALVSGMTNGSKSIVIVDDTISSRDRIMTSALQMNTSVDTFADAFMQESGGPTPPSTPPEAPLGTPRRSSHLLGQQTMNRSLSLEGSSFVESPLRPRDHDRLPSIGTPGRPSMHAQGHPFRLKKSVSLRRYASYHSGFAQHKSEQSFDATTFSGSEGTERMSHSATPHPLRVLRRRPGGDLRAVTNVGDLNVQPLRRPASTGSLTTYSDSVRSSYPLGESSVYVDVIPNDQDHPPRTSDAFSLGALADASQRPHVSLFSTHSSKPVMRPSFEKEAQLLAQIPDDIDDDGGVESALLKLEGKFTQRYSDPFSRNPADLSDRRGSFGVRPLDVSTLAIGDDEVGEEKRRHRHEHVVESGLPHATPSLSTSYAQQHPTGEELKPTVYQPPGIQTSVAEISPWSDTSYNSIPLLERGLLDHGNDARAMRNWSQRSVLRDPSGDRVDNAGPTPESSHVNSFDFVDDTDSLRRIAAGHTVPNHESIDDSFLNSESDDRSDLSSELSLEVISRTEYTERDSTSSHTHTFPPIHPGTIIKEIALPSHPPSPPMTLTQALQMSPKMSRTERFHQEQLQRERADLPPTPEFTPTVAGENEDPVVDRGATPSIDPLRSHLVPEPSRKTSVHLPFVLAFDSQILAQQFTLIEKDALNEIDWKDLIEMHWKDATNEPRSWVDFLRTSEPRGVEVVIARFNLVVKWAISECVLTQSLEERVRTIVKFIHIATHCRQYRNFATMTQLTVALTSQELSRLTMTWGCVPGDDKQMLKELEELVSPTNNFHSMRAEMEGSGAGQGCIPFVGIYTHDLLLNSERPSQIASTPTTEPLVNFERSRTDATIVKNLLRLLEASQLYRFLPIEGVTERCLWMAALSDEEIAKYGRIVQG